MLVTTGITFKVAFCMTLCNTEWIFLFRTPRPWWIDLASAIARLIHLFYFFRLKKKSFRLLRIKFLSWATRIFLFTWCVLFVTPAGIILKWIRYRKLFNFEGINSLIEWVCALFYLNWYEEAKLTFQAIAFFVLLHKINNTTAWSELKYPILWCSL